MQIGELGFAKVRHYHVLTMSSEMARTFGQPARRDPAFVAKTGLSRQRRTLPSIQLLA